MKLPVSFNFTLPPGLLNLLRDMAQQVNRLSDSLAYNTLTTSGATNNIKRLLTATATLDFPSIGAGAVATLNVTVTGAAVGDFVTACPPVTLEAGLVCIAFVTAANTVSVRVLNGTAAAIDPASASWKILTVGIG